MRNRCTKKVVHKPVNKNLYSVQEVNSVHQITNYITFYFLLFTVLFGSLLGLDFGFWFFSGENWGKTGRKQTGRKKILSWFSEARVRVCMLLSHWIWPPLPFGFWIFDVRKVSSLIRRDLKDQEDVQRHERMLDNPKSTKLLLNVTLLGDIRTRLFSLEKQVIGDPPSSVWIAYMLPRVCM